MQEFFVILMLEMTTERGSKYYSEIGRVGGARRVALHGNPGTLEGRSKGGQNAIRSMRGRKTLFKAEKIVLVRKNIFLAEFMGILFGDGHVGKYQTSITLDSETDAEYIAFVIDGIQNNFSVIPAARKRKNARAIEICISSVSFSRHMVRFGMKEGNKIQNGFRIPEWIFNSDKYLRAFMRGLFDTDGSIFLDRKIVKKKSYAYVGMAITSASADLRSDILRAFKQLGFSPTNTSKQISIYLRKRPDIDSYFSKVASHNPKHCVRYETFKKETWQSGRMRHTRNVVDG